MAEEFKMSKIGSSPFGELVEHGEQLPLPNNTNQNSVICEKELKIITSSYLLQPSPPTPPPKEYGLISFINDPFNPCWGGVKFQKQLK